MTYSPLTPNDPARVHVWVTGRVQGVGFRAYVAYRAQGIGLTGWVRNVGDDAVESIAEGTQGQIEQFIQVMKMGPRNARVDECRVDAETPAGEFQSFEIKASR